MKNQREKSATRKNLVQILKNVSRSIQLPEIKKNIQVLQSDENDWIWHYSY
ncbi:MAG: hypothetical protein ABI772_01275 [Bacteroidota bacterium]